MNGSIRYLGLLVLVAVLVVVLSASNIAESETAPGKGANQFGAATKSKVCGDKLCIESGGRIIMPSKDADKELEETVCFSSRVRVPCEELKYIQIEEKMFNAMNQEIDDLKNEVLVKKQALEKLKKSLEANVTEYSSILRLGKANIPVTIPLHQGYYMGSSVYYIITDSSDQTHADIISKNQGWRVEMSPVLANTPQAALSKTYMFTNGVEGNGIHGFQGEVFTSTPAQPNAYSALTSHVHVTWKNSATPIILSSEREIMNAEKQGLLTLSKLNVVLNMPQIVWPEGQMPVKANKTLTDTTPFVGGQVLDIDLKNMTTTFIAHRGWDSGGKTVYYIITDATPVSPAKSMGITYVPNNSKLAASPAVAEMFHFMNGILDSGPMGYQAGISSSAPGDENYSPMWKIYFIAWKDPTSASLLQTKNDIDLFEGEKLITVNLAKPMNADHIVNAPIVDPFQ